MMLPSGNDAAWTLAKFFGEILLVSSSPDALNTSCIKTFVAYMNSCAKEMGLKRTKFANPHGLPNSKSRSTAADICKLAFIAY